ncbi:DsbA family protein [Sporolactobacillus spathodeae]|uniref:Protein-disulfide isomerase n=1 Tax=Sporolactobacillus spathodeae TaxID=1465502 RepID=A0ABS2QB39_9BACL|nr:DsbA family protein [Sporolactobacillus spathodeae]MBM7658948.1 protein-disulfide isomerase [Sporolactobacillus spathodeae]
MSDKDKKEQATEEQIEKRRKRSIVLFSSIVVLLLIAAIFFMIFSVQQKEQVKPIKKQETHRVAQTAPIDYDDQPFIGSTNVPVRLAVFSDYRCPYCKRFDQQILPVLNKEYVQTNKVSVYFYNYVVLGPGSNLAANAAEIVYQQNPKAFFTFNQALFQAQGSEQKQWVTEKLLIQLAKKTVPSIDIKAFQEALHQKSRQQAVDNDNAIAEQLGVTGTPTIMINGKISKNALNLKQLRVEINQAIKKN